MLNNYTHTYQLHLQHDKIINNEMDRSVTLKKNWDYKYTCTYTLLLLRQLMQSLQNINITLHGKIDIHVHVYTIHTALHIHCTCVY